MAAVIRSLADSLRRFGDARLVELLRARPDLASPVPAGLGPLAARAAGSASARRALQALRLPELHVVEALAVLPDGAAPSAVAEALGTTPALVTPALERVITLALAWGEDELHLVRPLREGLRSPAGLAPQLGSDPGPEEAERIARTAHEALGDLAQTLAWGPARVTGEGETAQRVRSLGVALAQPDGSALIPRSVHLALRGGRVRREHHPYPPEVTGDPLVERFPGARDAEAVQAAFESVRLLDTLRTLDEDPPSVLQKGGLPQRDLRRLAAHAQSTVPAFATVMQSAWQAGLLGHDGAQWRLTQDWDEHRSRTVEERWAELVLAWATGHHLAQVVGTKDMEGTSRSLLSALTRRDGVRTRRGAVLAHLYECPALQAEPQSLAAAVAWAFPLVPAPVVREEVDCALGEATVLGLVVDGALTALGTALVKALEEDVTRADARLASALGDLAPPPVREVLLDADGTCVVPGRPAPELLSLVAWGEVVSRGAGLTLRFTAASLRQALGAGLDPQSFLDTLRSASRAPLPQPLEVLVADALRRHGRVEVARVATVLTADPEVLDALQTSPGSEALGLRRLAPTVAATRVDAGFALQFARRAGLAPVAVGADGTVGEEITHALRGGPIDTDLVRAEEPQLRLDPVEAASRIRAAEEGRPEPPVADRLAQAALEGTALEMGIVDGRGGVEVVRALPLSLEAGRLRARRLADGEEFTVLVHRVSLG